MSNPVRAIIAFVIFFLFAGGLLLSLKFDKPTETLSEAPQVQEQKPRGLGPQRLYEFEKNGRCYAAIDNPVYYGYVITTFIQIPCDEKMK
jgi:hypothetical protein